MKRLISGIVSAVALSGVSGVSGVMVLVSCVMYMGDVNASIDVEHAQTKRAVDVENLILYRVGKRARQVYLLANRLCCC